MWGFYKQHGPVAAISDSWTICGFFRSDHNRLPLIGFWKVGLNNRLVYFRFLNNRLIFQVQVPEQQAWTVGWWISGSWTAGLNNRLVYFRFLNSKAWTTGCILGSWKLGLNNLGCYISGSWTTCWYFRFLNNRLLAVASLPLHRLLDEPRLQLAATLLDPNSRPTKVSGPTVPFHFYALVFWRFSQRLVALLILI